MIDNRSHSAVNTDDFTEIISDALHYYLDISLCSKFRAGALLADDSPIHHSRIFCTRWNGLDMTSGLGEALDDAELEGSVIGQLQDAVAFVRNNSHRRWWKEDNYRENCPIIQNVP